MNIKKMVLLSIMAIIITLIKTNDAYAGFGISPPYLKNNNLSRGSHFEQVVYLTRSNADNDSNISIKINLESAEQWISIDKGNEFKIIKGETKTPLLIKVDIPDNAEYKEYKGTISIKISDSGNNNPNNSISIQSGGMIDINLKVGQTKINEFKVREVRMPNAEEGYKKWFMEYPGIVNFFMQIENTGNVDTAPTKLILEIYDIYKKQKFETLETNDFTKIKPFITKEISTELKTYLKTGNYLAEYKIMQEDHEISAGTLKLNITQHGSIPGYNTASFSDLKIKYQIYSILAMITGTVLLLLPFWNLYSFFKKLIQKKKSILNQTNLPAKTEIKN